MRPGQININQNLPVVDSQVVEIRDVLQKFEPSGIRAPWLQTISRRVSATISPYATKVRAIFPRRDPNATAKMPPKEGLRRKALRGNTISPTITPRPYNQDRPVAKSVLKGSSAAWRTENHRHTFMSGTPPAYLGIATGTRTPRK